MEDEGDLLELLAIDIPQLGCIDDLLNAATDSIDEKQLVVCDHHTYNDDVLAIDTRKVGDQVLELGFEAVTNNEYIQDQEYSDDILDQTFNNQQFVSDVGLDVAVDTAISIPTADGVCDNLMSDTIFTVTPTKMRKKPCRWTKEEHRQMKKALKDGLMGQWKKISRLYIPGKTPIQITSHAQKYLRRRNNTHKKRKSIHDNDTDGDDNDMSSYEVHNDGHQPPLLNPPTRPDTRDHVNNTVVYHQEQTNVVHDPSSSSIMSMVNYQSPLQFQSPSPMPPFMTPPTTRMHDGIMKMPPAAAYDDAVALYYAEQYLLLEEQKKMMMMMMMLKSRHDITMPPINNGLLPGAGGYSSNIGSFGVDQLLEPCNNNAGTSSSSSVEASTTTHDHHDNAYYYNAPLLHDQWLLQPEPLVQ